MSDQPSIIRFDDYECPSAGLLGGKVAGLVEMTRAGLHVPPGFAVTTAAHSRLLQDPVMRGALERAGSFAADGATSDHVARGLREAVAATAEAESLCRQIEAEYTVLGERLGLQDPPVAVRSSGQVEDSVEASFAGQFDTYLWVSGATSVVDHVLRVWAGSLASHALSYREHRSLGSGFSPMCVAVQLMVEARTAGVMFTLNPLTGDRSQVVIEGSWGLGEAVVRGDVNPDRWSVSKVTGTVTSQELGDKAHEYRFDTLSGGVAALPVDESRRTEACLDADEIADLVTLGKQIEGLRGAPQDIEWAIDGASRLFLLQVRPETVWAGRVRDSLKAVTKENDAVSSVISQLTGSGEVR